MNATRKIIPILVIVLVWISVFWNMFPRLNQQYFAAGGDGLKAYFCAWYHIEHGEPGMHFTGMNYPWGDSYFFTDGQPPVVGVMAWVQRNIEPVAHYVPGVFNFLMLLSIALSAIFLFLILKRFRLPDWLAVLVALGLAFLSPQMGRLPGHFSLAWGFWLPAMVYLVVLMYEKPRWALSIVFGALMLVASFMHMYFFPFAAALVAIYWLDRFFLKEPKTKVWVGLLHIAIQLVVPFIILQLAMTDGHTDRTMHPYGFEAYRAYPGSVFLPVNKWYVPFVSKLGFVQRYSWEGLSYIGLIASAGFGLLVLFWAWFKITKQNDKQLTIPVELKVPFWTSFLLLLFSFGLPFILGLDGLRRSIGFLSQLRGVGRFAWLFYYVMNIVVWVVIYRWVQKFNNPKLRLTILLVPLAILYFEAYDYAKGNILSLNNRWEQISDYNNQLEDNKWIAEIDPDRFQAIMPLPYFHVGSESIWLDAHCGIDKQIYIASLKTGLPGTGVMMGRTPLSQTYKNVALARTPWTHYEALDEYHNNKPLLLVAQCERLQADEMRLIQHAQKITENGGFAYYSLNLDTLKSLPAHYNFPGRYQSMIDSIKLLMPDTLAFFESNNSMKTGTLPEPLIASHHYNRILETPVKLDVEKPVYVRFWVRDYAKDLVARSHLIVIQSKPDHQTLEEKYSDIFRHIRTFNGDWALVEIELKPLQEDQIIKVLFKNYNYRGNPLYFDEMSVSQFSF